MLCQAKWDYQDRGMGFPPSMISGIQASISYPDLNQMSNPIRLGRTPLFRGYLITADTGDYYGSGPRVWAPTA